MIFFIEPDFLWRILKLLNKHMSFSRQAVTRLKEHGYKITEQRVDVINVLEVAKMPISAYEIEKKLQSTSGINLSTIYRILGLFEELHIAHKILSKNGYVKCQHEMADEQNDHHFLVCENCNMVEEFLVAKNDPKIRPKHFKIKDLKPYYELLGACHMCRDVLTQHKK